MQAQSYDLGRASLAGVAFDGTPVSLCSLVDRFAEAEVVVEAEAELEVAADDHTEPVVSALPPIERLLQLPPETLGHVYARYMRHFSLVPGFFPCAAAVGERTPALQRASQLVNVNHDFIHVLAEYETSDTDEIAVQSFVCGQAPAAWSMFLRGAWSSDTIVDPRYKHLRDLKQGDVSVDDLRRGLAARCLVTLRYDALLEHPVDELRRTFGVAPRKHRPTASQLRNTCAGVSEQRFFV